MKLCMMTYTMARGKYRADNGSVNLREICEFARDIGLEAIDFVSTYDASPKEARKMADDCGLITACYTFFPYSRSLEPDSHTKELDAIKKGLEIAHVLGTKTVMLPVEALEGKSRQESIRHTREQLNEAVKLGRDAGITITFENREHLVVSKDITETLRQIPDLRVCIDNGNVLIGGEDPAQALATYGDKVVHAHFRDWTVSDDESGMPGADGRKYHPAIIGQGIVEQRACIDAMKQLNYQGYINIEYDGAEFEPDMVVRQSADYLRSII